MIKTILITIGLHAVVLLASGLVHEFGHRYSLVMFKQSYKKKPFRTIIQN